MLVNTATRKAELVATRNPNANQARSLHSAKIVRPGREEVWFEEAGNSWLGDIAEKCELCDIQHVH
jgi:hypothetical protein